jgi:predicted nucleotidyltransferase
MASWTLAALREKRDEILAIARRHGARNVRVFGSVARGEAKPDSDVDIVVEFEPGRSLLDQGGLIMDLQDALGCKVDVLSARGMRDRLRARVEAEAVPI